MAFRVRTEKRRGDALRVIERWLREFLFEEWSLKLLALAIALGLWYGVTSRSAPATYRLRGVQLDFLLPSDMEISNEPYDEVDVTLRGNKRALDEIAVRNLVVRKDIGDLKWGERVVRLSPESVTMELPSGVRIEKIEPSTIPVRLERSIERVLEVEARLEGKPPSGFEVRGIQITPKMVRVRGPQSHIEAMEKAHTESISLEGQTESLTVPQTAIDILDRKVVPLDPVVTVRIDIGEERIEKKFAGVIVRTVDGDTRSVRPPRATVVIRGVRSVVEKLRAEDLEVVLEQRPNGATSPRLLLPQGVEGRIELVSTEPSDFSINK